MNKKTISILYLTVLVISIASYTIVKLGLAAVLNMIVPLLLTCLGIAVLSCAVLALSILVDD